MGNELTKDDQSPDDMALVGNIEGVCEYCKNTKLAAEYGHLECLTALHEEGVEWHEDTVLNAAGHSKLNCLKYAIKNGCPIHEKTLVHAAGGVALDGSALECLKYAHLAGAPWHEGIMHRACGRGGLSIVVYVHRNFPKSWDQLKFLEVVIKDLEILIYLKECGEDISSFLITGIAFVSTSYIQYICQNVKIDPETLLNDPFGPMSIGKLKFMFDHFIDYKWNYGAMFLSDVKFPNNMEVIKLIVNRGILGSGKSIEGAMLTWGVNINYCNNVINFSSDYRRVLLTYIILVMIHMSIKHMAIIGQENSFQTLYLNKKRASASTNIILADKFNIYHGVTRDIIDMVFLDVLGSQINLI
jgi:hypothetical protein